MKQSIRVRLNNIDTLLKKDCVFCGTLLIDMIDNDVNDINRELPKKTSNQISATQNDNFAWKYGEGDEKDKCWKIV